MCLSLQTDTKRVLYAMIFFQLFVVVDFATSSPRSMQSVILSILTCQSGLDKKTVNEQ